MAGSDIPVELGNLPNKPLVEALFELRWETNEVASGIGEDPGWANLPFKFYSRIQPSYPEPVELPAAQIPEGLATYAVRYQFRKAINEWPLVQIGPGIMTVNDTVGYSVWGNFSPLIQEALSALKSSYNGEVRPAKAELRYINSSRLDPGMTAPEFLARYLHTTVQTVPGVSPEGVASTGPSHLNVHMLFPMTKPVGDALLSFANGGAKDDPTVVWQLAVRSTDTAVPRDLERFGGWLDEAHAIIDKWFVRLTEGELIAKFKAGA
jgi:uncharacterized protein (TIGR04255 family)